MTEMKTQHLNHFKSNILKQVVLSLRIFIQVNVSKKLEVGFW